MAAMCKQGIPLYIVASLSCVALMLLTVPCVSGSQSRPINYKPITSNTPPCSTNHQENCVTHRPPANEHQRPCNRWDRCRGGQRLTGLESESMSKTQVSAATKQFGLQVHSFFHLVLQWVVGWVFFLYLEL